MVCSGYDSRTSWHCLWASSRERRNLATRCLALLRLRAQCTLPCNVILSITRAMRAQCTLPCNVILSITHAKPQHALWGGGQGMEGTWHIVLNSQPAVGSLPKVIFLTCTHVLARNNNCHFRRDLHVLCYAAPMINRQIETVKAR